MTSRGDRAGPQGPSPSELGPDAPASASGRLPRLGTCRAPAGAQCEPRPCGPFGHSDVIVAPSVGGSGNPPKVHVPSDSPRGQQSVRALAGLTFTAHLPPCRSVHSVPQREGPILSPALAWLAVALGTSASLPEPAGWAPLARVASRHRSSAALASCWRSVPPSSSRCPLVLGRALSAWLVSSSSPPLETSQDPILLGASLCLCP